MTDSPPDRRNSQLMSQEPSLEQSEDGYRYSIEPFLIADFAIVAPGMRVLDVGTGCGIIAILLSLVEERLHMVSVEVQKSLVQQAKANIEKNALCERIEILEGDFIELAGSLGPFDLVVSNPPYRKVNTGRINPNQEKAIARHEIKMNLESLVKHGAELLTQGGRMILAYPPERLTEVLQHFKKNGLFPSRMQFIHGSIQAQAKIFLVEAIKGAKEDFIVMPPLCVYNENSGAERSYTPEMLKIYASFNYTGRSNNI